MAWPEGARRGALFASRRSAGGFTLVELVIVIVLVAILAAYASSRFIRRTDVERRGYYDATLSALRYARTVARASDCPVQITLGAGGYALTQQTATGNGCDPNGAFSVPVRDPTTHQPFAAAAPAGAAIQPAATVVFGADGQVAGGLTGSTRFTVATRAFTLNVPSGVVSTP